MRYFYKNNPNRIIDTDRKGGQQSEDWFWNNIGWWMLLFIFVICCIAGVTYDFSFKQVMGHFIMVVIGFYGGVMLWTDK